MLKGYIALFILYSVSEINIDFDDALTLTLMLCCDFYLYMFSIQQGPSATNNSALSGQSTPAHFDKAKWQSVKLVQDDARSDSDRASSTASSRKHVTFGADKSENLTEIRKEKDPIQSEDKGERTDVGTKDVVAVESGATEPDYAELEKYAELYSDLDELEEGDLEDIGDLKEKLEEYFSLGVKNILIGHYSFFTALKKLLLFLDHPFLT